MSKKWEDSDRLLERLKQFALRIIRLCASLPNTPEARLIRGQLLRAGTSPGAHYSEARRAKSDPDFISKVEGGLQELEESAYWLDLLALAGIVRRERLQDLLDEAQELIKIFVSIVRNTKLRRAQ
jgi:four helix bundle protein